MFQSLISACFLMPCLTIILRIIVFRAFIKSTVVLRDQDWGPQSAHICSNYYQNMYDFDYVSRFVVS